jgi:conjugative transfer region lipoprotein (TIGR03751 family)
VLTLSPTATEHHSKTPPKTMAEIYQQHRSLNHENKFYKHGVDERNKKSEASNKTHIRQLADFQPLPNPAIPLYVYPHFAGIEQLPIPGYYTVFALYHRDYFLRSN